MANLEEIVKLDSKSQLPHAKKSKAMAQNSDREVCV